MYDVKSFSIRAESNLIKLNQVIVIHFSEEENIIVLTLYLLEIIKPLLPPILLIIWLTCSLNYSKLHECLLIQHIIIEKNRKLYQFILTTNSTMNYFEKYLVKLSLGVLDTNCKYCRVWVSEVVGPYIHVFYLFPYGL